mgnify:CR=1 FL=1
MPNNENKLTLPLLITRGLLVFPSTSESIGVGRAFSVQAVDEAKKTYNSLIFITAQKDSNQEDILDPSKELFLVGSLCRITALLAGDQKQNEQYDLRVYATKRVKLSNIRFENDTYLADGEILEDILGEKSEEEQLIRSIVDLLANNPSLGRSIPRSALKTLDRGISPNDLSNTLGAYLPLTSAQKEELLSTINSNERLKMILNLLQEQNEMSNLDNKLNDTVRRRAEKSQKEYYLREKMKAIKDELGEGGSDENSEDAIKKRLEENPYPENVKKKVLHELRRYEMMPEASLEASLIMTYVETLMNVPWYQHTEDNEDLENARKILDEDHYGLKKVKERIIEYLAVKKSTGNLKAPILCFYGPPGCGKTSLGRSIAKALGRKFFKASLGGISDEAEIRGHRRTYVGSMPGRIIQGMTRVGVNNPVFLLDEIDKIGGANYKGDPSSAMLEVLDPEQNTAFNDNFLEEPYDLSNVLFLCTANYLENVPAPLLDRLELIEVPSYTELEKIQIATGFLIKKQMAFNGVKEGEIEFTEAGLKEIIECYTREAGVRQLERLIASCCRKAVVEILQNPSIKKPIVIDEKQVQKYLGVELFEDTKKEKAPQIGVVTGLAYTEFGGDILPIEVTYFPSKSPSLVLTGKLGDVMKESATIALDYVRANAEKYGISEDLFNEYTIHIHVPEGAVPKDGPSAGVAITTAIISCLAKIPVDNNVAMTGEVTLRGNALPIGGLREKSLAALRSGIKTIIVPKENKKDVSELPNEVKKDLKIIYMENVDDALKVALMRAPTPLDDKKA